MAQTIIISEMAFGEINNMYDNTPPKGQFITMFNQAIAKINADANINLPQMIDKSGTKPDAVTPEDWDALIDYSGNYTPLSDEWVRRLLVTYIGYRVNWIEEGANSAETQECYGDFMMGLREFKNLLPAVVDSKYNKISGQKGDLSDPNSGNIETMDLSASPYSGGII